MEAHGTGGGPHLIDVRPQQEVRSEREDEQQQADQQHVVRQVGQGLAQRAYDDANLGLERHRAQQPDAPGSCDQSDLRLVSQRLFPLSWHPPAVGTWPRVSVTPSVRR